MNTSMQEILFLAHRIPYPPNKGDKIRSFHILRYLCAHYRVHLGAFVDDPKDWEYREPLERICEQVYLLPLQPLPAKLRSLVGLLNGMPLTVPYYADPEMAAWVRQVLGERTIERIFVFSSAMAQYVQASGSKTLPRRIIDFVDVDSDKWRQYAKIKPWPARWIYAREADHLLRFDRRIAAEFDHSLFVTEEEAALFRELAPETGDRVGSMENGVDTDYFRCDPGFCNPYPNGKEILVFTGAMDYWANVDAVVWFAKEVFPALHKNRPSLQFHIVGARPAAEVLKLMEIDGITVAGGVADMRPYLQHARIAIAPLRIARGIQNKVLEAMAMGKPVVASVPALEGMRRKPGLDIWQAGGIEGWRETLNALLADPALALVSERNRAFVETEYSWNRSYRTLESILGHRNV